MTDDTTTTTTAAATASSQANHNEKPLIIYAIPGSQYVFKVLAPLQAHKVPHYVQFVPLDETKRNEMLPCGGKLVPQMKHGSSKENSVNIDDSEAILEYLSKQSLVSGLYPTEETHTLSKRISDGTLAAMVWYYNWIHPKGHEQSLRQYIGNSMPWFLPWFVVDYFLKSSKEEYRQRIQKILPNADLDNASSMEERLHTELEFLNSQFVSDDQQYLIPQVKEPTAADFSAYALLERLVGGTVEPPSSDTPLPPAIPEWNTKDAYAKLWKWHLFMRTHYKVEFKGKRPPKELLET